METGGVGPPASGHSTCGPRSSPGKRRNRHGAEGQQRWPSRAFVVAERNVGADVKLVAGRYERWHTQGQGDH